MGRLLPLAWNPPLAAVISDVLYLTRLSEDFFRVLLWFYVKSYCMRLGQKPSWKYV